MSTPKKEFSRLLLHWHKHVNKRLMPWKGEKDPYKIWLSEIILQQTRVEQGLPYYEAFVKHYPTVKQLAKANDEQVFKLWEGLGYYSRCRNLLATARIINTEHKGKFPTSYEGILALKGIGPYTASAIASFAYGLPHAVVDGNVFRVLSRYFGMAIAIDTTAGKKQFGTLAEELLYTKDSAAYNQAIMDFGATVCTPKQPQCASCPLATHCIAFKNNLVAELPVKEKKLVKKTRWLYYFIIESQQQCLVQERVEKDIWQNLFEFLLFEVQQPIDLSTEMISTILHEQFQIKNPIISFISADQTQQLTHQTLHGRFIHVSLKSIPAHLKTKKWVTQKALSDLAFPRFITRYLADQNKQISLF